MSTKCRIAIKDINGYFRSIYCHYDGYPEYTGKQLVDHYNTNELVNDLIELGGISFLEDTIEETWPHSYYGKGEYLNIKISKTLNDLLEYFISSGEDYLYLWDNNQWKFLNKHKLGDQLVEILKNVKGDIGNATK